MTVSRFRSGLAGAACAALLLVPAVSRADTAPATGNQTGGEAGHNLSRGAGSAAPISLPSLAPLVQHVLPAVVNISAQLSEQAAMQDEADEGGGESAPAVPFGTPFDQFLRRFFQNQLPQTPHQQVMALGSGFIIDPKGYVVTNNHVVAHADKVTVILQDGTRYPAKVVGRDPKTDLALLSIKADKKLSYVDWGNSDNVKVGDWVIAVGNPFGLGGTVTAGIVSAIGRNIGEGPYDDFLQTDAPINRGNSGGPTFDLSGHVIGINTAIYSPSGGSVGIGFAIPSNNAKHVIAQLMTNGKVTWGWLGVAIQNVTPAIAKSLGLDPKHPNGALVASVVPDSPAAKAGLKSGDVITKANGHQIKTVHDLPRLVAETPVGSKLDLTIYRDGNHQQLVAEVGEMPQQEANAAGGGEQQPAQSGAAAALGMQLAPLTSELRSKLNIGKDVSGVVVARIADSSPARSLGVEPGDVIVSIDRQPATTPRQAAALLKKAASSGNILLLLDRQGTREFVGLSIEKNGAGKG